MKRLFTLKLLFLVFTLGLVQISIAQTGVIDSLKQVLKTTKEDTNKVNILFQIGRDLYVMGKFDTAIVLEKQANDLAQKLSYTKGIASSNKIIGNIYGTLGNYSKAIEHYNKAINAYKKTGNQKAVASTYNNMGLVLERQGNYVEALKILLSSLKVAEEMKDTSEMGASHYNIGNVFLDQNKYDDAIGHYLTALKFMKQTGNKRNIATGHIGLGNIYVSTGNYPEALKQFNYALSLTEEVGDMQSVAGLHNNLANIYSVQKNYSKALEQLFAALKISQKINDLSGMSSVYGNIGAVYISLNNAKESRLWLQKGLALSKDIGAKEQIKNAYKNLAQTDSMLGNYKDAYTHYKLFDIYADSLVNEESSKQIAELQTIYKTEKKENEIQSLKQSEKIKTLELERKNAQLKERNLIVVFVVVVFLLLIFFGVFLFRHQHIKNIQKINQAEENERRRMAKDIHDDLGSGLSKIKFMSEVISAKAKNNPEILSGVKSIADTSVALVENMRDLIWALNPENTTLADLVAHIREYGSEYLSETKKTLRLNIADNIPDNKINPQAHRNIFFIAKEALQNIVKHAQAEEIEISVNLNSHFNLRIADNGIGMTEENRQGDGLRNMRQRAESLGANFKINSGEKGTELDLKVPLSQLMKGL